jgi:dipeptidyl aminopeptidase/acylaminoacyl peptidase
MSYFLMRKLTLMLLLAATGAQAQQTVPLTVEKIMRDQKWIGIPPSNYRWSDDSKSIYFDWNPENKPKSAVYRVGVSNNKIIKSADSTADQGLGPTLIYNRTGALALAEKDGDIFLLKVKRNTSVRLTNTLERESNVAFMSNDDVVFQRGDNLFQFDLKTNELKQLTNFVKGRKPGSKTQTPQDAWLKKEQSQLFDVIKQKDSVDAAQKREKLSSGKKNIKAIYLEDKFLSNLAVSPDGRYVTYQLVTAASGSNRTVVPNYVTSSGYTEDIPGRSKVGEPMATYQNYIFDKQRDSVYAFHLEQIPGIKDLPDYLKDYPKQLEEAKKKNEDRKVRLTAVLWNTDASGAVVVAESIDNKDRWILKLDFLSGNLGIVDRQRDEAWIGGPGISSYENNIGWLDNRKIYYESEASGYAHLYVSDVRSGEKQQLTSGKWEVQTLQLSRDKKTFYFTANKEHPGITHFYKLSTSGGTPVQITSMKGGNQVSLSPDEKWLAINYSYMNKPWELYVQANKPGAKAVQITHSTSAAFNAYDWRKPDMITFKNRYAADVYARVYPAKNPAANHPAVVFVHGAGYLQNVHYWWSTYSREYMFNNLLADNGYTVIDIDYTGSSGYGRDFRTGIYRHMGGKDLTDQVDGVKVLVEKYGVNPKHVGIYGGSYGGFITLMGLFKEQDVFASGAALRAVTDWAHYNHGYTSNILNEPFNDELAYQQSSPINFAAGLRGNLLMCHGMVDVNVHFQDIVRLSQRLIELGKNNWELAVYPVESHGFTEPSSWTDEYKRIFKLFETTLK